MGSEERLIIGSWFSSQTRTKNMSKVTLTRQTCRSPTVNGLRHIALLAYIKDLPDSLKSSDARLFADDSFLYLTMNGTIGKRPLSTGGAETNKADEHQFIKVQHHTHNL